MHLNDAGSFFLINKFYETRQYPGVTCFFNKGDAAGTIVRAV